MKLRTMMIENRIKKNTNNIARYFRKNLTIIEAHISRVQTTRVLESSCFSFKNLFPKYCPLKLHTCIEKVATSSPELELQIYYVK